MRVELITTGEELLDGRVLDTNTRYLASKVADLGLRLHRNTTTGDDELELITLFKDRMAHTDILLITGGLGPTDDDRTSACVAAACGRSLERNQECVTLLDAYYASTQRETPKSNYKQCDFPVGATVLINSLGTAAGFLLNYHDTLIVVMPGVPYEMKAMFTEHVYPVLQEKRNAHPEKVVVKTLKTKGVGESTLADRIADLYPLPSGMELGYCAMYTEVHMQLWSRALSIEEAEQNMAHMVTQLRERCDEWLYDERFPDYRHAVLDQLKSRGYRLAVAESCTGGLLGQLITEVPGASALFDGGVIAYSNDVKQRVLQVPESTLKTHGAVSEETAAAMCQGLHRTLGSDVCLSITGIAGPDGGSEEKPVGTVYIGIYHADRVTVHHLNLKGERGQIQRRAALLSLRFLGEMFH